MGWIRNLESLDGAQHYTVEYELASECQIPGLLDYADGKIICAPMSIRESKDGLWLYNLILTYPFGRPCDVNRKVDEKGYYFKDSIVGELLALISLFFRCRFYLISSRDAPANRRQGLTIKTEYPFLRRSCNPGIHPPVFENGNKKFGKEVADFLDLARTLDVNLHQKFVLACHHYALALKEIGIDPEMIFIRLVSAIEALAKDMPLATKDDALEERTVIDLIEGSKLNGKLQNELKSVFEVRKSGKRFIRFVETHCAGFFKGGNFKAKHLKIKRTDLPKTLAVIYKARSRYLHEGESMSLITRIKGFDKWDLDPGEGVVDNRLFPASKKLPHAYFFEGLVRKCILDYLQKNSTTLTP